jgi:hypothetical protein
VNERPTQNRSAPGNGKWKAPTPTPTGGSPFTCFACGQPGHKAAECPQNSAVQKSQFKGSATHGRLNHLDAEEAQAAPGVVYGMFLVNGNTASVLFDSRATCSYISTKFAREYGLPVTPREKPIITSSPLRDLKSTHICKGVSLTIEGLIFKADLTLLPSTNLDVILGMDWSS